MECPLTGMEQQMVQLNLSDSGDDSGIENREHATPPMNKPRKLPSLRSPMPSLVFYTKTTSEPKVEKKTVSVHNMENAQNISADDTTLDSAETTLQNVSAGGNASLSDDTSVVNAKVVASTADRQTENVLSQSTTSSSDVSVMKQSNRNVTSENISNVAVVGLTLTDISRKRHNSACSVASTTSDISTDTYHTCYDNIASWSDSDSDDYLELEQAEELTPHSHLFFIRG